VGKIGDKHINPNYSGARRAEASWKTVYNNMVKKKVPDSLPPPQQEQQQGLPEVQVPIMEADETSMDTITATAV
jgi:hypothetical protein